MRNEWNRYILQEGLIETSLTILRVVLTKQFFFCSELGWAKLIATQAKSYTDTTSGDLAGICILYDRDKWSIKGKKICLELTDRNYIYNSQIVTIYRLYIVRSVSCHRSLEDGYQGILWSFSVSLGSQYRL